MYLKVKNNNINILRYSKFVDRFKSFKFYLEKIDFGIWFPKRKFANTYFFCQRVDICFTDKEDKIVRLYENVKSEKLIFKFKAKNVYFFPLGTCKDLKVGEVLNKKENNE